MRKCILTIAAILIACVSAYSQSVTETRRIKTTALQIYENYKVVISGLYSNSAYTEDNYMALFDDKATLYNDIIPANTPTQLSPADYFTKFKSNIKRIYPAFSDFKMGEPVSVGNKWQIKCSFVRKTRFRTQKEMKYPEWPFSYTLTVEMDKWYNSTNKVYDNAKIVSVEVDNPLEKFFVIENKENILLTAKSGDTLKNWDEEYNSRIFPENKWKIKEIQVVESGINKNIFEYSISRFSKSKTDTHFYQPYIQRFPKNIVGVGVNYSPIAFGNKMSEDFKNIEHKSSALSFSLFYGMQVYHQEKATAFLNLGLDLNRYSHEFNGKMNNEYNDSDIDGDSCLRRINITSLNENVNTTSVSLPLSFEYVLEITEQTKNPFFLSFELGLFAECSLSSSSKHILNANRCGLYTFKFGDEKKVEFDHYYDYGNFDVNLKQNFAFGIFGGAGLWYALNSSSLLKFNLVYKHSFNSPLEYEENYKTPNYEKSRYSNPNQGMRNVYFRISWVKTIGGNK